MRRSSLFSRICTILIAFLFFFHFGGDVKGQEENDLALRNQDLIILFTNDTLNVIVVRGTPDVIEYKYENETVINTIDKKQVHKIIYRSGRVETCYEKKILPTINSKNDWEKVIITFDENDIIGLVECGTVVGKSGWGGVVSVPAGESAMKEMRKEAAELGAPIVLIVSGWHKEKDKPVSGYGRGVKLTGKAYK